MGALSLREYWLAVAVVVGAVHLLTMALVTAAVLASAWTVALAALWVGSVLAGALLGVGASRAFDRSVTMAQGLAAAAQEIARGAHIGIPYAARRDEIGELARALEGWRETSAEREVLIRQAPVGICQLDRDRHIVNCSPAFTRMVGLSVEQVRGRLFRTFVHPEDVESAKEAIAEVTAGSRDHLKRESRLRRPDGSYLWCSTTLAAVRAGDGLLEGFVSIVEDISERKRLLERATQIQRELLPQSTPRLDGYDLAGACRPAQDVAGDFYDWTLSQDGRHLDLTVADVMGKGLGPGLVMATVRAVLRAAAPDLGPAARVRLAAQFLLPGEEGLFVTMFHGQLDLATGVLRYVDAGHGYCLIRRAGGELEHLPQRCLPVGILEEQEFREGEVRLEPGDALIVHSDGLVETEERSGDLSEHAESLDRAADAGEMVWRLMRGLPAHLQDDVTVLALRRAPRTAGQAPAEGSRAWPGAVVKVGARLRAAEPAPTTAQPAAPEPPSGQDAAVTTASRRVLGFLPAQTQRQAHGIGRIFGVGLHIVVVLVVTAGILVKSAPVALVALWAGSILRGTLVTVGISSSQVVGGALGSLSSLAAAAREIARGEQVRIPRADRSDEFGELARALQSWQTASMEREIMIQRAPVGICHLDPGHRVVSANPAFARMLGLPLEQIQGRLFRSFVHPEDLDPRGTPLAGLIAGTEDRVAVELRMVRADQSLLWCSAVHAALRVGDGPPDGFVAIVEDVSERKQQLERAARIQRELLPQATPVLQGYDLAGACRPAQDVAGDFYDWTLSEDGGRLDLTVADVMGKSLGSGMVMATLRAVLRTAARELGPAERVRLAAEFLPRGAEEDGLFVTLFHGRLHLATGLLCYVDAGHGYAEVRRPGGELVRLTERSQPVGMWPEQRFVEGTIRLEPGDALIVYSDGLVKTEERAVDLGDYADDLDRAADAQEVVARLLRRLPSRLQDDVTLLALRRAPLPVEA